MMESELCWTIYIEDTETGLPLILCHTVFSEKRAKEVIEKYQEKYPSKKFNWEINTCDKHKEENK